MIGGTQEEYAKQFLGAVEVFTSFTKLRGKALGDFRTLSSTSAW
jgi:hypothetical protein